MSHKHLATDTHVGKDAPESEAYPAILARMKRRMVIDSNGCWLWQGFKYPFLAKWLGKEPG